MTKSFPKSPSIFFSFNKFLTLYRIHHYMFFIIRKINIQINQVLTISLCAQYHFNINGRLWGLHKIYKKQQIQINQKKSKYFHGNFLYGELTLLQIFNPRRIPNIFRHQIIKCKSICNYFYNPRAEMEIELQDMEHGKPINFSNMAQEKQSKIKQMKSKKQYNQLLEYANNLPPNRDKYLLKANALMHLRKWKELVQCCDKGLQSDEDSQFYNMKGRAQGKLGNMQEKAVLTRKAIEIDPNVAAYYRNLGAALYKLKQYESAIENHKKAISMEPQNSINYHNVGAALFRLEKYEEAKQYFKKSLSKNNKEALSHSWLGDCHKKTGSMAEAIQCYTRAYEVSGNELYKKQRDILEKEHGQKKGFFSRLFG